jgi:hypothetical protein
MAWRLSKVTAKYETQKYYISFLYQNFMYNIMDQQRTVLWTSNQCYQHTKEKYNVNVITMLETQNSQHYCMMISSVEHQLDGVLVVPLKGTFLSTSRSGGSGRSL